MITATAYELYIIHCWLISRLSLYKKEYPDFKFLSYELMGLNKKMNDGVLLWIDDLPAQNAFRGISMALGSGNTRVVARRIPVMTLLFNPGK
ncbi:MAG TPA: hypothetical protein PKK43_02585 [Spirochaetota bacterium]|nr:hypothetical protein [Spirochaetota bacterium]